MHGLRDHVLSDLLWSDLADNFYGAPLLTVIAGLVLLVAPLLWLRFDGASLVALVLFALVALLVAWRFRILRRLSRSGVEVDAELIGVSDDYGGETDFRHATYAYEYAGSRYFLSVRGADFFVGQATRYGERIVLLVDPLDPDIAVVIRTREFGDPSRWQRLNGTVDRRGNVKEMPAKTRGARRCTNAECEYAGRWFTGTMTRAIYGKLRCNGANCGVLHEPADVIDPENEDYPIYVKR